MLLLPYPHLGQRTVLNQAARHNVLVAGRRWRKTSMCMSICVETAHKGLPVLWAAPTYEQVEVGLEETMKACQQERVKFNRTRTVVEFPNGGRIFFRSLEKADNKRGPTAVGAVVDECQDVDEKAFNAVVRPMLFDTRGWSWRIGTPKGKNWFWRAFMVAKRAQDNGDTAQRAWNAPTLGAYIPEDDPENLLRRPHPLENDQLAEEGFFTELLGEFQSIPRRTFRQEYLAEFLEDGGEVFPNVGKCSIAEQQEGAIEGHRYVMGVDLAKTEDWTSVKVIDCMLNAQVAFRRFSMVEYHHQAQLLKTMNERFKPDVIMVEDNGQGATIEIFQREGLPVMPFRTTNQSKAEIIESLALAFDRQRIKILPKETDPTLTDELDAFAISRTPGGLIKYGAPDGMHDDDVMALALAWYGAEHGRVTRLPSMF